VPVQPARAKVARGSGLRGAPVRFSELYGISRTDEDDWFDTYLPADTKLFVDPFLIYDDTEPRWSSAHDHILHFFALVLGLVATSKGNEKSPAWGQAKGLLLFPETAEFCLGMAEGSPNGSGSGSGLQLGMLEGARTAIGLGIESIEHMEMLVLFQGGVGLDRISDAVCNILKSYFIEYTQEVCARHDVSMKRFRVRNAAWDEQGARWCMREVALPVNPFVGRERPVLLVPERFLKDIPVASPNAFWDYAWENKGEELRRDFNYDIATKATRHMKATLAKQHPDLAAAYLSDLETVDHRPYSVSGDPKLLTLWYEHGAELARRSPLAFVATRPDEFPGFVLSIVEAFAHNIEHQDGWQLLWNRTVPRSEKIVQALFRSCAIHYCRANNIDLTGESNAGRGPVDFKFAVGWSAKAVVEIKLMRNSGFWDGILEQTPTYALAEGANAAVFVAVAFTDAEMAPERIDKVRRATEMASENGPAKIEAVVIDARQKESASNLKAPKATRDRLHGRTDADGVPAADGE